MSRPTCVHLYLVILTRCSPVHCQVVEGYDVVEKIEGLETGPQDKPRQEVVIEDAGEL